MAASKKHTSNSVVKEGDHEYYMLSENHAQTRTTGYIA